MPKRKKIKLAKPINKPQGLETKIKIVGIGGGGSAIVSEIAPEVKKASFVAVNTDRQALQEVSGKVKRFQLGQKLTRGMGTGMDPALGEQAAQSEREKIKKLLEGQDFCILVSCLGGGTSSGVSPAFAEISQELHNITLGIFTLPFEFEGSKRGEIARASLEKLKPNLNTSIVIPNEGIFLLTDKKTSLKTALSTINKLLAESLNDLIRMIYSPGFINVDFADVKTVLAGKGKLAYLNTVEIESSENSEQIVRKLLSNPLYPYSPQQASGVLFNIDGGVNLSMHKIEQIGRIISDSLNSQPMVFFGVTKNKTDKVKITLLANGCQWADYNPPTTPLKGTSWAKGQERPKKILSQNETV
jgi:cell division protein FtsZ